ncbi:MAG: radical SAM protein [Planctomycetes bacterium]|nr:radical SAM protein [Planctomycetota bacterium]
MLTEDERRRYDAARPIESKPFQSGCYAPHVSLYFHTTGRVQACCKNDRFALGDCTQQSLDEIWQGARVGQLRAALERYAFGAGCTQCEWQIKTGNLRDVYTRIFDDLPVADAVPQWPAMLEFALSNTCNFACVMCYGDLSSAIRARDGLPPLRKAYDDRFFADLRKYLPHLHRAKFFGGEPFLAAESLCVWEMMIEDGLTTPCHVTTNGSIWNDRVLRILERLPVSIAVSIDGASKATFEQIRVHGDFDVVMRNAERFHASCRARGTEFGISHCLMRQNWHELPDLLALAERFDARVFINTVTDPSHCSLFTLPDDELLAIADAIERAAAPRLDEFARNREVLEAEVRGLREHARRGLSQQLAASRAAPGLPPQDQKARAGSVGAALIARVWAVLADGDPIAALQLLGDPALEDRRDVDRGFPRARALRLLRRFEEADLCLREILAKTPRRALLLLERAWLAVDQGRAEEAAAFAAEASTAHDAHEVGEVVIGHALAQMALAVGHHELAHQHFDRLCQIAPERAEFRVGRAWASLALGQIESAVGDAEWVIAASAGNAGAREILRIAAGALGKRAGEPPTS